MQNLGTIGLSVRRGFDWRALEDSTLAGLRRAAPVVEQIIDERWRSLSETVNGSRGSLASGRCSYDWALNAANTNHVGTEVTDQVVYVNTAVDVPDDLGACKEAGPREAIDDVRAAVKSEFGRGPRR